jgi:hypothetical protein
VEIGALKRDDFEVWVPFGDDAEVLIRHVPLDGLQEVNKSSTVREWDRQHQPVERMDAVKRNRLLGRAAVRDWKGLTVEGEEFPYSPENLDFLMTRWSDFARFVGDACTDLQALAREERRRLEKNSVLTSGQEGTSLG